MRHPGIKAARPTKTTRTSPGAGKFLYKEVAEALRQRVEAGTYAKGSRIPPVAQLAAEFGVSTITVRHAIRELSLEGVLAGRQGLGVFVASKQRILRSLSADHLTSIEESIRRTGASASVREIDTVLVSANNGPFPKSLTRGDNVVYRLERVLLVDEEPVGLDTIWLPRSVGDMLMPDLSGQFVLSQLEAGGLIVDHIHYRFEAATADESQSSLLRVVSGFPLLVIWFTAVGQDGLPIVFGRTMTRADRFSYEYRAPRSGAARSRRKSVPA